MAPTDEHYAEGLMPPSMSLRGSVAISALSRVRLWKAHDGSFAIFSKVVVCKCWPARQAGMERIELDVFASNKAAIALYMKLGFVTEGVKCRARKLDGDYDDNVFMALLDTPTSEDV